MKRKILPFSVTYSHIAQEALIKAVANQHLDFFPAHFFKTKWLDNKRSIQNAFKDKKYINAMKIPAVIATYDVEDDPKNTLEASDYPFNYASNFIQGPLNYNYWRIYANPRSKVKVYAAFTRKRITINFRYIFPDNFMRDDLYSWMLNTFRYGDLPTTYGSKRSIYANIPNSLVDMIGKLHGYNSADLKKHDAELMEYSSGLIVKRKVTMKDDVMMYFLVYKNPTMKILQSDKPEKADGEIRGMLKSTFEINESLIFEPNFPQLYIIQTPEIVNGRKIPDYYTPSVFDAGKGYDERLVKTRDYTINPIVDDFAKLNFTIISNNEFVSDHDGEENIPIDSEVYGQLHLDFINYLKNTSARDNFQSYYKLFLYYFDKRLVEGIDYIIDWDNMNVKILYVRDGGIYRLVAAANRKNLAPLIKNKYIHDEKFLAANPNGVDNSTPRTVKYAPRYYGTDPRGFDVNVRVERRETTDEIQ